MLGFSPSHFHNIVVASSSNPVFCACHRAIVVWNARTSG